MKWFKHDSNANTDAKLEKLMIRFGLEGYGLYWYCLELIAAQIEKHNLTFELEHDSEILSRRTGMHVERVQDVMSYMTEIKLFENDRGVITCLKMASRTDEYTQKIMKKHAVASVVPTVSGQTPDSIVTKSVLIEEKEEKEEKQGRFTPPTLEEIKSYISEKGYQVNANDFINHYEANGWMRGKTKVKSWKACVRTWIKSPSENKQSTYGKKNAL